MVTAPLSPALAALTTVLEPEPDVALAIAFGSLAQGRAGFESDVDVAVWSAAGVLPTERRIHLIRALAAASGRPVDLVDLRTIGVPLSRTILRGGTILVSRDPNLRGRLTSRMLADVEDFLPLRERILRDRRQRWIGQS